MMLDDKVKDELIFEKSFALEFVGPVKDDKNPPYDGISSPKKIVPWKWPVGAKVYLADVLHRVGAAYDSASGEYTSVSDIQTAGYLFSPVDMMSAARAILAGAKTFFQFGDGRDALRYSFEPAGCSLVKVSLDVDWHNNGKAAFDLGIPPAVTIRNTTAASQFEIYINNLCQNMRENGVKNIGSLLGRLE